VKVVPLIVEAFIPVLNIANIFWLRGTAVAPFTGLVERIVGVLVCVVAPVVNVQTKFAASAFPGALIAPVVIVALYTVLAVRLAAGAKMAVLLPATYVTPPVTAVPPGPVSVNVAAVIVAEFIDSLNVAEIFWLSGTPAAPFTGIVEVTLGIVPVVNVQTKFAASAVPVKSVAPVVMVPVYTVLGSRLAAGVNVAIVPEYVTAPMIAAPPGAATVNDTVLSVVGFIAVLKVAVTI
jgi:hypothetical protein